MSKKEKRKVPANACSKVDACWDVGCYPRYFYIRCSAWFFCMPTELPAFLLISIAYSFTNFWNKFKSLIRYPYANLQVSPGCLTAPEPDFWSTVGRTWRPNPLTCTNVTEGTLKRHTLYSEPFIDVEVQIIIIIINTKDWTLWSVPSPGL